MKRGRFNEEILDKCVLPNENLVSWRIIDNQVMFLHKKEKSFCKLNETSSFIWKRADGRTLIKKIIDLVSSEYDVDRDTAEKDALEFIKDLLKKKIFIAR